MDATMLDTHPLPVAPIFPSAMTAPSGRALGAIARTGMATAQDVGGRVLLVSAAICLRALRWPVQLEDDTAWLGEDFAYGSNCATLLAALGALISPEGSEWYGRACAEQHDEYNSTAHGCAANEKDFDHDFRPEHRDAD
jgi:hypothetical protein